MDEWCIGSVSVFAMQVTGVCFPDLPEGENPGQQLYHDRAEQLGQLYWGSPSVMKLLSGMEGALLANKVSGLM